ncbi:hypothetical protein ABIE33_007205 [Ensifer sp. 4252]
MSYYEAPSDEACINNRFEVCPQSREVMRVAYRHRRDALTTREFNQLRAADVGSQGSKSAVAIYLS